MRLVFRALALVLTFVLVGAWTAYSLIAHAVARGTPEYEVRLGGAVGGLFAGGAAALLLGLALVGARRRSSGEQQPSTESEKGH